MAPSDNGHKNNGHKNENQPVGAALVIGAGIAGMQSSLDLAESGDQGLPAGPGRRRSAAPWLSSARQDLSHQRLRHVHHVAQIGRGGAASLTSRLMNCAEVEEISPASREISRSPSGNFHGTWTWKKCTGCGDCATACPISLADDFNGALSRRKAIYKRYPQAIPNAYAIEKLGIAYVPGRLSNSPESAGLPALVAEGRYADAYRTILEDNPFPSICGRVCNHKCEEACNRAQADGAVNVALESNVSSPIGLGRIPKRLPMVKKTGDETSPAESPAIGG